MKKCLAIGTVLLLLCNTALAESGTTTQRTFKTWKVEGAAKPAAQQDNSSSQWKKNLAAKAAEKQNAPRRAKIDKENKETELKICISKALLKLMILKKKDLKKLSKSILFLDHL